MTKHLTAEGITSYGTHGPRTADQPVVISSVITEGPAGTVGRSVTLSISPGAILRMIPGLAQYAILNTHPDLHRSGYWEEKAVNDAIKTAVEQGLANAIADAEAVA